MLERVRFAPSPTGPLHIGGLRTALFNFLFTKNKNGVFVLRLEDTDRNRLVENSDLYIEKALAWAGISPDEGPSSGGKYGPYRQSERIDIYDEKINILIESGKAYYAFDSNEKLNDLRKKEEAKGRVFKYDSSVRSSLDNSLSMSDKNIKEKIINEPYVVRLKVEGGNTSAKDLLRGTVTVSNTVLDDKILIKADGFPTYHFANVVDDYLMKITTVIRGEEWLPSLALHTLIYDAFGWEKPKFIHLPLILKPTGKGKLSKRDGAKGGFPLYPLSWEGEEGFKEMGFLKTGVINYLALLGWSPGGEKEIFSLEDLIRLFGVKGLQKGGAKFDFEKAKWINHQHMSKLELTDFEAVFPKEVVDLKNKYPSKSEEIFLLLRERLKLASDFEKEIKFLLEDPKSYDQKILNKLSKNSPVNILEEIELIIKDNGLKRLKENIGDLAKNKKIDIGSIMQLFRLALVGRLRGPDIITAATILEKSVTLKRISNLKIHLKNKLT